MIRTRRGADYFDEEDDDDRPTVPTWIMGIPYTELREEERRQDVFSTMWHTYRSGYPRMEPYGYTDDSGWGCMLRSAQMLMTQALQRHSLGRSWRVPRTVEERLRVPEYRRLVYLFADHPGEDSLFSIHNMCQIGIKYDKLPGEWYGPTTAACVLRDICELHASRSRAPPPPLRRKTEMRRVPSLGGSSKPWGDLARKRSATESDAHEGSSILGVARNDASAMVESVVSMGSEMESGGTDTTGDSGEEQPLLLESEDEPGRMVNIRSKAMPRTYQASDPLDGTRIDGSRQRGASVDPEIAGPGVLCQEGAQGSESDGSHSRPLRVFVSQGDVVYIDELEAIALRGRPGDKVEGECGGKDGHELGIQDLSLCRGLEETDSVADVQERPKEQSGGEVETGHSKELGKVGTDSPAFFDPLLNPGSGADANKAKKSWSSAVVLLVPLRLGLHELSAGYIPGLLRMLQAPQSLGFLGGRPNHATYFIGAQGDTLTGLDPHTTQSAPELSKSFPTERYMHSLHCHGAASMDIRRIDPSLALAFYLPDRASFEDLSKRIRQADQPPFSVEQTRPDYEGEMGLVSMISQREEDGTTDDDDEYVFVKGPER